MPKRSVWIGYDDREQEAFAVARTSVVKHAPANVEVHSLILSELQEAGLYTRPIAANGDGRMKDVISDAPMSTQFAVSRFLVPTLLHTSSFPPYGWAMFCDCDVLVRKSLEPLFEMVEAHPEKALFCVPHQQKVAPGATKMDGQVQTSYQRKNWSSVMLLNGDHPSNNKMGLVHANTVPGRDLHRFDWLDDSEIGFLDEKWNWLVGHSGECVDPAIVHFTDGGPWLPKYMDVKFANEWMRAWDWLGKP